MIRPEVHGGHGSIGLSAPKLESGREGKSDRPSCMSLFRPSCQSADKTTTRSVISMTEIILGEIGTYLPR